MLTVFLSLLSGALIVIILQLLLFNLWFSKQKKTSPPSQWNAELNWDHIATVIQNLENKETSDEQEASGTGKKTASFLNVCMIFLFQELRDDAKIRATILSKINIEINEVLTSRLKSRIIKTMSVHNFSAGTAPPRIRNIHINKLKICPETKLFRKLHITADIVYKGCAKLALQASTFLGKNIYISVEVTKLSGQMIFILNRHPQTHWGWCFESDPEVEFNVVSSFQQRSLPHLTRLVTGILKRTLRKKHTKPNYRRRYGPLFKDPSIQPPSQRQFFVGKEPLNKGKLIAKVVSANRVIKMTCKPGSLLYCTVALGNKIWDPDCCPLKQTVAFDAAIHKVDYGIGLNFKAETDCTAGVIVDDVHKSSPAFEENVRQGDVITAINNKRVSNFKTALAASLSSNRAKLSIRRPLIKWNKMFTSGEASQDMTVFQQDSAKEPTFVEEEEFLVLKEFLENEDVVNEENPPIQLCRADSEKPLDQPSCPNEADNVLRTQSCELSIAPYWDEQFLLNMQESTKYFTVCLWREESKVSQNPVLIGYCNINVVDIILQCISTRNNSYNDSIQLDLPSNLKWQENVAPPMGSLPHILPRMKSIAGEVKLQFTYCLEDPESCEHSFALAQSSDAEKCGACNRGMVHRTIYLCSLCGVLRHERCLSMQRSGSQRSASQRSGSRRNGSQRSESQTRLRSHSMQSTKEPTEIRPGLRSFSFLKGSEKKVAVMRDKLHEIENSLVEKIAVRRSLLAAKYQCQIVPPAIQEQLTETEESIRRMSSIKDKLVSAMQPSSR